MSIARGAGLILILAATAVGAAALRAGTVARSWRIQVLQSRQVVLHRELWAVESELAHLTAPGRIRQRVEDMALCVGPPAPTESGQAVAQMSASDWAGPQPHR